MTKAVTVDFETHVTSDATTLATLWKITRNDGTVFAFTDHDRNLPYGGLIYLASTGYTGSDISTSSRLNVDNLEVASFFDAASILEADVAAGLWDRARIDMYRVNYNDTSQVLILRRGETGQFKLRGARFVTELRGMMQYLHNQIGRVYTASCDANLGDARCGVNLVALTIATSVTAVTSRQSFTASALGQAAQYFQYGLVTFTSGACNGFAMEVRSFASSVVELQLPMARDFAVADNFTISPGCDKTLVMCINKYNNAVNFRGFAHIPGLDRMIATPSQAALI